jgi:hypothetical protein
MTMFDRRASACRLAGRGSASLGALAILAACGGGGGGGAATPAPTTLSITSDATTTASAGAPVRLHAADASSGSTPTWTLAGPGSLSATTGADITYTPPDAESLTESATAVVTASADGVSKQIAITVAVGSVAGQHWDIRHAPSAAGVSNGLMAADHAWGRYLAVSTTGDLLASADGQAWSTTSLGAAAWPGSPRYFSGAAMASAASGRVVVAGFVPTDIGGATPAVLYSDDGVAWNVASEPQDMFANIVINDGTRFLAFANDGVYTSPDGSAWTLLSRLRVQNGQWITRAAHGRGLYVVVGHGGLAATSPDAVHWTVAPLVLDFGQSAAPLDLSGVVDTGDRFVAVAANGHVATSTDGQHWSASATATQQPLHAIALSTQGELVAIGEQGATETSVDALHWTLRSSPSPAAMTDVIFADGAFMAVGEDSVIQMSSN